MDLRRNDYDGLKNLASIWKTTPGAEFEAMIQKLDLTGWQDIVQGLRNIGMREAPQIVRMNICLADDIRFTLEGAGVIQAYCQDNRIVDKPFVAMLKENIADATPVDIEYYGVRAKLKREIPLDPDDARVKDAIVRWGTLQKYFRMIQRFEFVAPSGLGIRFDISIVRSGMRNKRTFQEAKVSTMPVSYEAEIELTAKRESLTPTQATDLMIRGMSWLLQGQQRSFVLVSRRGADAVRGGITNIFRMSGPFKYPGPQPATLERVNIDPVPEPGVPNLRTSSYNVTDKADGLRCMLYVAENGRIFLVDSGGRVYATGKQTDKGYAGVVLDGEWIRQDRHGAIVSHYYAFDILADKGDIGVTKLPFMIGGDAGGGPSRQTVMAAIVTALSSATTTTRVPITHDLQIGMKSFRSATDMNIFSEAAAATLSDAKSAPYTTDGLIFTPNAAPLPLGRGTWAAQLKWKPASHNTIDFLAVVDRERGPGGELLGADAIGTKYREDVGKTVRHKTLRLFVGSRRDAAFADPRATILSGEPLPVSLEEGDYRPVEFRPLEPRDPMASICYVAIGEGGTDPAGAAPAATTLDINVDEIRCESGDIIQNDMIVEMSYHPERAPGWRWAPMRVRHDKTERFQRGAVGGTMNADWVASSIWSSLHNPVTEAMIVTGNIIECAAPMAMSAPTTYYNRKAPARDLMKTQCLRNFHNDYVKRDILLRRTIRSGNSLCDLAMGKAGDLHKWIAAGVGHVFGCDYAANSINDPQDGAYSRLLSKMIDLGGREATPPMVFVQADAAQRLVTGEAGVTAEDKAMLQQEFGEGGRGAAGFDVVSCMFALHYMFRDEITLYGFLTNLADTVKVGGYFVGCGFDGDAVAKLLSSEQSVSGRDGATDIWNLTKRYGTAIGNSVPPSASGLGLAVDVDFISIGETYTEYLVSWPYLQERLAEVGLELLTADELANMGLTASSQMFGETWAAATKRYEMSDALRRYSFLNRWYIFRRVTDRRPSLPVAAPGLPAPPALTEFAGAQTEAPVLAEAPGTSAEAPGTSAEAPAPEDVITLEVPEEEPETGPINLLIDATVTQPDARLGPTLTDWPQYMSLGTRVEIADMDTPTIKYPSIEAAIASAKYKKASSKPTLGPQIFKVDGVVNKKFERDLKKLRDASASPEAIRQLLDEQVNQIRNQSSSDRINGLSASWNQEAWLAQRESVYRAYLAERYRTDARFREMVQMAKAIGGQLMFVNGKDYNELGVGVRADGTLAGGDNKVGKWMMELAV